MPSRVYQSFIKGLIAPQTKNTISLILIWIVIIVSARYPDVPFALVVCMLLALFLQLLIFIILLRNYDWSIHKLIQTNVNKSTSAGKFLPEGWPISLLNTFALCCILFAMPYMNSAWKSTIVDAAMCVIVVGGALYYVYFTGKVIEERAQAKDIIDNLQQVMQSSDERNRALVAELFKRQFATVDKFASVQYEYGHDNRMLTASYGREAAKLVKQLAPDSKELAKCKEEIDRRYNNLISRLQAAYPTLPQVDISIYMYTVLGLSAKAMCVLLDMNIENIYNRRSRLKAKLKKGDEEFLKVFE